MNDNMNQDNLNFYHNKDNFDIRPKNAFNKNNQIKMESKLEILNQTTIPISDFNKKLLKVFIYIYYNLYFWIMLF